MPDQSPPVASAPPPTRFLRIFLERLPTFTADEEKQFQAEYYERILPTLRLASLLLAGLAALQLLLHPPGLDLANIPQLFFWLCIFGLTWLPVFARLWQPTLVCLSWATAAVILFGASRMLGHNFSGPDPVRMAWERPTVQQQEFFFMLQLTVLMVTFSISRLNFRQTVLLQVGVLLIGFGSIRAKLPADPHPSRLVYFVLLPGIIVLLVLLLSAFTQEQLARRAFWAGHLLAEERNSERRHREQTQGQLRVLAQAIGGIVHDLGNPLTVIQMGADFLKMQGEPSPDVEAIREAAQMLNALRLSLIEQTRVLEGKPIPVDLRMEPLRPMIEAGNRFQNSRYKYRREVSLHGHDFDVFADRPKLVTVFMNLIGNSLKYSDGEIRVLWQREGDVVLIGITDQGKAGKGISWEQAGQLFIAFGRLEAHAQVEGTGLGLVSVQKIVEAHSGTIFVEGHADGTAATAPFTTSADRYPSLLEPGFLTGFVIALPSHSIDEE